MKLSYVAIAIMSSILMGLNVVVSKIGVQHFPPLLFSTLRFASLLPFILFIAKPPVRPLILFTISMCWGVIYIGGVNYALSIGMPAGIATILVQFSTFIGFALSWAYLNTPPKTEQIIGSIIGFLGICSICYVQGASSSVWSILVLLFAALSFAIGTIIAKKFSAPPLSLMIWINTYSVLPMLLLTIFSGEEIIMPLLTASVDNWKIVLMAGWVSTFLGSFCWLYVVQKCDLNLVMPFRFLVPVFGSLFAIIIFGEVYPLTAWIGGGLVLLGLAVIHIYPIMRKIKQNKEVVNV